MASMQMFPNTMNQNNSMNMSTPVDNLPLKQNTGDTDILEDPVIQNVLQEFKTNSEQNIQQNLTDSYKNVTQPPQTSTLHMPLAHEIPDQQGPQNSFNLRYNNSTNKKIFDYNIAKRVIIITMVVLTFLNTNIICLVLSKLPPNISLLLSGNEMYINILVTFGLLYVLMYYDIV